MNPSCHTLTEKSAYEVASKCLITAVRGDNSTEIVQRESVNELILDKEPTETKTEQTEDEDEDGSTFGSETKKRKRKRKKRPAKLEPAEGEELESAEGEEQTEEGPTFLVGVKKPRGKLKTKEKAADIIYHMSEIQKHVHIVETKLGELF